MEYVNSKFSKGSDASSGSGRERNRKSEFKSCDIATSLKRKLRIPGFQIRCQKSKKMKTEGSRSFLVFFQFINSGNSSRLPAIHEVQQQQRTKCAPSRLLSCRIFFSFNQISELISKDNCLTHKKSICLPTVHEGVGERILSRKKEK